MCGLINRKSNNYKAHRYIAFIMSVCCVFSGYAQQNISQRISDVLYSQDVGNCKILMQQINDSDIILMPDSTIFEYYYLAGWYSMENNEIEKQIDYLIKAKEICENKLGINNNVCVYFEIIKALGEACEELNKEEEALLWYEEGIIKGFPYLETNDVKLQSYFKDIRNYSANIYEVKGYANIAEYLRDDKPLNYIGSFDHAEDMLYKAIQLYNDNKCSEALKYLDEAKSIFKRHGIDGREMMQPLSRMYLKCYAKMGDTKKINALLKTKKKTMFYDGTESFIINDMYDVISEFILTHYNINTAKYYYNKLLEEIDVNNQDDLNKVRIIGCQIDYFQKIYSQIDSLENVKKTTPILSYDWGIYSLLQSNLLIKIQRYDDANKICEQIYDMSVSLKEDSQSLHWFVLMNLSDYSTQIQKFDKAECYLKEQLAWLDSKKVSSDTEEYGWIYNKLGIVYLNKNKYKDSKKMFAKAEKILLPIYGYQSHEYATILHNKGRLAQLESKLDEAKKYLEESVKIQIVLDGKATDRTTQYLDEVNHAINVRL